MVTVDNSLHSYVLLYKIGMMRFRKYSMDISSYCMMVHPSSKHFASLEATLARLVGSVKEETNGREKGKGKMAPGKAGIVENYISHDAAAM